MPRKAYLRYTNKNYTMSVTHGVDTLTVDKRDGSDWCDVRMEINGLEDGRITLRSREHAEALRFMLGQLLGAA